VVKVGLALILGVSCAPHSAGAQSTGKMYQVGFLGGGSAAASAGLVEAFRDGMRERRWIEGGNFRIEMRFAENRIDRLPNLAAELASLQVDVIVAMPAAAAIAAKQATAIIPIVMASTSTSDPVALGLIASLARPGGNVTGLSGSVVDLYGKRLQILKEVMPNLRRVAILSNPRGSTQPISISNTKVAAQSLGVVLQFREVREPGEFESAFVAMAKDGAEAIVVVADPLFGTNAKLLAEFVAQYRLPSMYAVRGEFDSGGLIMYGSSGTQQARQAAAYVDKILKGAKPAELPVEQPTKIELVINLRTAKALGIAIPPPLLLRADHVIE
jgi:putative ABC transport system substrate-binding protein